MTAPSKQLRPTIRFTHGGGTYGRREFWLWRCTCGQRLGRTRSEVECMRTADDHASLHSGRGEYATLEVGGLR